MNHRTTGPQLVEELEPTGQRVILQLDLPDWTTLVELVELGPGGTGVQAGQKGDSQLDQLDKDHKQDKRVILQPQM